MVYRGRPSTGCKKCRERKIKCDERPEGCIKCAERNFKCPGYDRTVDAFFHDETKHVQTKAKISNAKAIAARDARDIRDVREAYLQIMAKQCPGTAITASLIDQGISFFMSYYCTGVDQPSIQSIEYQQHLSTHGFHPLVSTTMTALGIAGVANLYMDPRLKAEATRWYLEAIKMANKAISSPEAVKADSTLTAVNLLSMFEATFNDTSLAGWSNHVDGAASLIRLRGMEQFSTPAGQRMYLHTVGLLTMNCMGKGIPLPQYVHDLNSEVMKHLDTHDPRNRFFFLHIKTIDLRARILNQSAFALSEIIDSALELEDIAVNIFKDQGADWDYDVVHCEKSERIFENFYHVYPTATAAQTWNWVRYNRIYFHDIIRNCILAGFATSPPTLAGSRYHEQLAKSARMLYQLQSDIIASMPQFMHDVPDSAPSRATTPPDDVYDEPRTSGRGAPWTASAAPASPYRIALKSLDGNFRGNTYGLVKALLGNGSVKDRLPIVRVAGGYSTVWALYVAAAMPMASPESQDFVQKYMSRIEHEFGIKQARVLGQALRLKRYLDQKGAIAFGICPEYLPPDGTETYVSHQHLYSKVVEETDESP
ncbi:uncharacterized protein J4E84_005164 [Alternaria hordeiaustralica]|uniref:uncharacterized protein n=1 Tax=Alternaria hordeiaustralica TaxID=1187925 RepID=UPI0020C20055|nr:uncharacterized protein J4E84_005164 [Alternaria hordeiaustralica]KAI4688233.1 hypothetical protein J4E84_005164 [Alternaria hordeiaustralica]